MPGSFSSPRHAIDSAANGTAVHPQLKAVLQDRGHIGMGHAQPFIHLDPQRQRVGTQLHGGGSQGVRGLPPISSLHSLVAHGAATDSNVEAPPDRLPHDLLLKLRLNAFYFQHAPALTLARRRHGDHFIDLFRNGFAVTLAIGAAGVAPGWFRIWFWFAAGKWCGLPFVGALGFFQLLLQPLVLFAQTFSLVLPLLLSPPQLLDFLPQLLILATIDAPLLLNRSDLAFQFFNYASCMEDLRPRHRLLPQRNVTDPAGFVQLPFPLEYLD